MVPVSFAWPGIEQAYVYVNGCAAAKVADTSPFGAIWLGMKKGVSIVPSSFSRPGQCGWLGSLLTQKTRSRVLRGRGSGVNFTLAGPAGFGSMLIRSVGMRRSSTRLPVGHRECASTEECLIGGSPDVNPLTRGDGGRPRPVISC